MAARVPRLAVGYRCLTESAMVEPRRMLSPDELLDGTATAALHEHAFARAWAVARSTAVPALEPWRFGETQVSLFAAELADLAEASEFARRCAAREGANRAVVVSTSRRRARAIARALRADGVRALPLGLPDRDAERRADDEQLQVLRYVRETGTADEPIDVLFVSESEAMAAMLRPVAEELERRGDVVVGYAHGERVSPAAELVPDARARAARALAQAERLRDTDGTLDEVERGLVRALRRRRLVEALLTGDAADALLDELSPRLLVIGNDRVWTGQLLVQAAHRRGIPVLCVQDGLAADVPAWWPRTADFTACNGTHLRDLLVARGVSPSVLSVTGQPRNDRLFRRAAELEPADAKHALGLDPSGLHLLVALQGSHDREYVRTVLHEASRVPGATILVRTHPWQSPSLVSSVVEELRLPNVELRPGDEAAVALRAADVVVSQYSTMLVEAALLGTPAVAVTLSHRSNPIDLAAEGIAVRADRRGAILPAIRAALELPAEATAAARAAAERLIGPFDGGATARVADYVTELLEARPADPRTASAGAFARSAPTPERP